MAYLKPPALVRRIFNPLAMRFGLGGSVTLEVRRRRSGGVQRLPVIPLDYDGSRYLVSTRGESDWVRNLRGAGEAELRGRAGTERVRAVELPVEERGPVIDAYRRRAGKMAEEFFRKLPDPADHPVFRLDPR